MRLKRRSFVRLIQGALPDSAFGRNVLTLLTGTGIAQLLPVAASPILTRIYSPRDFGHFALFVAITGILSIFATGRYEIAVLLPKEDQDAQSIVDLSLVIAVTVSALLFGAIYLFGGGVPGLFSNPDIAKSLYLVPAMILATGVYQTLTYWFNRRRQYRRLAVNRTFRSLTGVLVMLLLGALGQRRLGLIIGTLAGQVFAIAVFLYQWLKERSRLNHPFARSRLVAMAHRYRHFAMYSIPAGAVNALSQQMPTFVFSKFFSSSVVGYYNLSQRVLAGPGAVVATAIGDVFWQRAGHEMANKGNCRNMWIRTFKLLLLLSVPPFLLLAILSPSLFAVVFGEEWRVAGSYARILAPFYMLSFTASILSRTLHIAEKQRQDMLWQFALFILITASLLVGGVRGSPTLGIFLFSLTYSGMYVVYLVMSFRYSGGRKDAVLSPTSPEAHPSVEASGGEL